MVITRNAMEKRIDGLEQQLAELRNLIIARNRSNNGRPHTRRSHIQRKVHDENDGDLERDDSSRSTVRSSSGESSRDFGGRKLMIPIFRGDDA